MIRIHHNTLITERNYLDGHYNTETASDTKKISSIADKAEKEINAERLKQINILRKKIMKNIYKIDTLKVAKALYARITTE